MACFSTRASPPILATPCSARAARRVLSLALLSALTATALRAQDDAPPYTLHVYVRMVQVPTLVLSPTHQPLPPIDPNKFSVSLDSGPSFRPSHVRREGDDPITLAILMDASGNQSALLPALSRSFAPWISGSLKPQDHVVIYAVDCALVQTHSYEASNPAALQHDLDTAIASPLLHGKKSHAACGNSLHLWDSMAAVMEQISTFPGRRVLLVVTDGYDGSSYLKWEALRTDATLKAVTIFGLSQPDLVFSHGGSAFGYLCQLSGGLYKLSSSDTLPKILSGLIDLLRGRYILEFPMPANPTQGKHDIRVMIDHSDAFIRPSGVTVPLPDPAIATDPSTIPSDSTNSPQLGKRHPLDPHP